MAGIFKKNRGSSITIVDDPALDFGDEDYSWFIWGRSDDNVDQEWLQKGNPTRADANYYLRSQAVHVSGVSASDGVPGNETISNNGPNSNINSWHHLGGDHLALSNDIDVFEDAIGAVGGRKAVNATPGPNTDALVLGKLDTVFTNGQMAWLTIWRKALTFEQKLGMSHGINPFCVAPDEKEIFMPILGFGGGRVCGFGKDLDQCIEDFSTYTTQAEAEAVWVSNETDKYFVSLGGNYGDFKPRPNGSFGNGAHGISFDLGFTVHPDRWVLRFKNFWHYDNPPDPETVGTNRAHFGLSSADLPEASHETAYGNENESSTGFQWVNTWGFFPDNKVGNFCHPMSGQYTCYTNFWKGPGFNEDDNQTRWYEVKRVSRSRFEYRIWDNSDYTTAPVATSSRTICCDFPASKYPSEMAEFRWLKFSNFGGRNEEPNAGVSEHRIDDVCFWDGISEVPADDYVEEKDWGRNRLHGVPAGTVKMEGNPNVELIENYL